MSRKLPRSTPEAQGVRSSAILGFIGEIGSNARRGQELHGFMLVRHGNVVAEGWWAPHKPDMPHMLFSLSKSFTSTAIGMAVDEGRLTVEDQVIGFFPDRLPETVSENLRAVRVKHLLSMSTGHSRDCMEYLHKDPDGDWVRGFLSAPVEHEPGSIFCYDTAATYMLSAILRRITGETLMEYLGSRLLVPLGIEGAAWDSCPMGTNIGGYGLSVRTEDIAKSTLR